MINLNKIPAKTWVKIGIGIAVLVLVGVWLSRQKPKRAPVSQVTLSQPQNGGTGSTTQAVNTEHLERLRKAMTTTVYWHSSPTRCEPVRDLLELQDDAEFIGLVYAYEATYDVSLKQDMQDCWNTCGTLFNEVYDRIRTVSRFIKPQYN